MGIFRVAPSESRNSLSGRFARTFAVVAALSTLASLLAVGATAPSAAAANPGDNLLICSNTNYGGINQARFAGLRDKLGSSALFGPTGQLSRNTFSFDDSLGTNPSAAALASAGWGLPRLAVTGWFRQRVLSEGS